MKRNITTMILIVVISLFSANKAIMDNSKITGYKIQLDTDSHLEIEFNVKDVNFSDISTEKGVFTSISIDKGYSTRMEGAPALPTFHELIALPYGADPEVEVVSYDSRVYKLSDLGIENRIAPAQPSYSKSSKPEDRKFIYNESAYLSSKFNKDVIATISKSGTMRGVGVGVLEVNPFRYNPTAGTIEVYNDIKVIVSYNNTDSKSEQIKAESYSPYFESSFNTLINYEPSSLKADLVNYPVTYLIVASDALSLNADLQRLIDWKTEKGFNVLVEYVSASSDIFTNDVWVEEQWNTLTPKPSFILLVGDESGTYNVESQDYPPLGSTGGVTRSDLEYGVIGATSSSNRIPSMYVGRFSVRSEAELTAQVDKTIWYEKEQFMVPTPDLDYLTYTLGCAGVDAGSWDDTHGNPQISYGWTHYFTSANGMTNNKYYLSDTSINSSTSGEIINYISNGANFYNYTAHGGVTSFGTPSFTISSINALSNSGKYPLVVGNCCLTNSFGSTECFGEAWLNVADKGAIGYIGASMSTYWDEDLAMGVGTVPVSQVPPEKDIDNPGMYDGVMALGYSSQAAIKHVGLMAVEQLSTGYTDDYWSSYHLMGDPSVQIYFGIPENNVVSHSPTIAPGVTTYEINAIEGSYVALSDDSGTLHGVGVVGHSGSISLDVDPFVSGFAHLVVTAQFKQPYFKDIPVEELTGPYVMINDYIVNGKLYGTTGTADIELKNVGIKTSANIIITATTENPFISLNDDNENYGTLVVDGTLNIQNCISFDIDPNIPDKSKVEIEIIIEDDYSKNTYSGLIDFIALAPNLVISKTLPATATYPGTSQNFSFNIANSGSADITNITADLIETSGLDIVISEPIEIAEILSGTNQSVDFVCDFGSSIPNLSKTYFNFIVSSSSSATKVDSFHVTIGMTENFETGDFTVNEWTQVGDADWVVESDSTKTYEGLYCSRSGDITDDQYSRMSLAFDFIENGSISFYKMISSEKNYDFLRFFIDDDEKGKWSGISGWEKFSYDVTPGIHYLHWEYKKDGTETYNSDCGWIDNILIVNGTTGIEREYGNLPNDSKLYQNYPNPFNPMTEINFYIANDNEVRLSIFNSSGQLVKELVKERLNKGMHTAIFNASSLNSGIYFYTLEIENKKLSNKMLLIK